MLSGDTQVQVQGLYTFPSVDTVAHYLVSEAIRRQADYIEICLEDRERIDLEVRDNGLSDSFEAVRNSLEMRLLAGLGTVAVTTCLPSESIATLISLDSLATRPTSRLRKPGQIVSICNLYSMFPPREREYLSAQDHSASLNLSVIRPILIHPDVHLVVKIRGKVVLELEKTVYLRDRLSAALGEGLYQPVDYTQGGLQVTGAITGLSTRKSAQFLYLNQLPIDCIAIKTAIDRHIQSAVTGKAAQINLAYVLNLRFNKQPQVRMEGNCKLLELTADLLAVFDDILHVMVQEKLGITVKCDKKMSLKRKQPAALTGPQRHTIHADLSDKELLELLDKGSEQPLPRLKRPKLSKPVPNPPNFPLISAVVEEVCSEPVKTSFALPAALQSFLKFASVTCPSNTLKEIHKEFTLSVSDFASLVYVGQYDKKCLMGSVEKEGYLLVVAIDQHAAHERVNLEELQANVRDYTSSQLANVQLSVSISDAETIKTAENELKSWGFSYTFLESSGKLHIQSVPVICGKALEAESLIPFSKDVSLPGLPLAVHQYLSHSILCSKACKQAVKFGDSLAPSTAIGIISRLAKCKLGLMCAHGRPTAHILLAVPVRTEVQRGNRSKTPVFN